MWTGTGYKTLSSVRAVAGDDAGYAYASAMAEDMHRQVAHSPCHVLLVPPGDAWFEQSNFPYRYHIEPHRQLRCQRHLINGRRAYRSTTNRPADDDAVLLWFNNITGSWVLSLEYDFLSLRWTSDREKSFASMYFWLSASDASASPTLARSWASPFGSTVTGLRFVSGADMARAKHREAAFVTAKQATGAATVYFTAPLDSPHQALTGEYQKQPGGPSTAVAVYLRTTRAKNLPAASIWWDRGHWHIGCREVLDSSDGRPISDLVASPADSARYDPPELSVPTSWKLNKWDRTFEPGLLLDGSEVGAHQLHAMQHEAEDRLRRAAKTVWILMADSTKATPVTQHGRYDSSHIATLFGEYHRDESILAAGRWLYIKPKGATNGSDVPILAAYELPDHNGSCKTSIVWMLISLPPSVISPMNSYHCSSTRDTFRSALPFAWDAAYAAESIDSNKWSWPIQVATGASSSVCVTSDGPLPWQFSGLLGSYKLGGASANGRVFYCRDQHSSDYCLQHWYGETELRPSRLPFQRARWKVQGPSTSFWTFHEGLAKEPFEWATFCLCVRSDATFAENIDGLFYTVSAWASGYWFGLIPWAGTFTSASMHGIKLNISACEPPEPSLPDSIVRPITRSFKRVRHVWWHGLYWLWNWTLLSIAWVLCVFKAVELCGWTPGQGGAPRTPAARAPTPQTFWPPALHVESIPLSAPVPRAFVCPITMGPMANPAITPRGTSYDREALREWLRKWHRYPGGEVRAALPANMQPHGAPVDSARASLRTQGPGTLELDQIAPNYALRQIMEAWIITQAA